MKLACDEHATVMAMLYGKQKGGDGGPQSKPEFRFRKGSVRIHDGYEFATDAEGGVAYSLMDLAAIHLELPFEDARADFGTNKVMDIRIMVEGDGVFAFRGQDANGRGAHAMRGDSGGPCFREDKKGNRWLTGIITTGKVVNGMRVSAFTSTFHHRAWLQEQMSLNQKRALSR